ncbi:hypothetical protein PIIN_10501 [Serendipita indica DSM 11827]|uniref:RNase H type-1 domain-containing protein n=1 Tax=Serendipita indica (strain DSM 11827) TaxID=1109443 RepID=G4TYW5_SERID|nr:hypothetical protein PIIN_10501 [Serendipita indica DSM 11827]
MEKITPALRNPNAAHMFKSTIDNSREQAIERDKEISTQSVAIYTDGSGMEGKIGAAAVLYRNGRRVKAVRYLLGAETEHTVHEGELVGIALGIHLARTMQGNRAKVNISLDNQAAIQSITRARPNAGQHVVENILSEIEDELSDYRRLRMEFTWVPGHEGIQGNEAADEEAKKAITEGASRPSEHPRWLREPLPSNLSAVKQECKRLAKEGARERWNNSKRFDRMSKIDETMPSGRYLKLTDKLSRRDAALLIQLRTGHTGLNGHLNRINRADSPWCPHCGERNYENLMHVLYICPKYGEARAEWERSLRGRTEDLKEVLGTEDGIEETLKFIRKTRRWRTGRAVEGE